MNRWNQSPDEEIDVSALIIDVDTDTTPDDNNSGEKKKKSSDEKTLERRRRNRASAAKCRQKLVTQIETLTRNVAAQERRQECLVNELLLNQEMERQLKAELRSHQEHCGCATVMSGLLDIGYIQPTVGRPAIAHRPSARRPRRQPSATVSVPPVEPLVAQPVQEIFAQRKPLEPIRDKVLTELKNTDHSLIDRQLQVLDNRNPISINTYPTPLKISDDTQNFNGLFCSSMAAMDEQNMQDLSPFLPPFPYTDDNDNHYLDL